MKSQIPGMCAELNEKIDVLEATAKQIAEKQDKKDWDHKELTELLRLEAHKVRGQLQRLRTTVSTLQELKDGEL